LLFTERSTIILPVTEGDFILARTSDTRERLLQAALALISTRTYGGVGVEAICREASVKKGSFYHFFDSKADLAIQALENHWEHYRLHMQSAFSKDIAPLDRLYGYFDGVHRYNRDRHAENECVCGCPFFHLGDEIVGENEKILDTVHRILEGHFSFFRQAVLDAHETGDIAPGHDPEALARYVFAFFEGTLSLSRIHNDPAILLDLVPGTKQILGLSS
jgi:TetR/AcrR family transcriptional repressor of nem operon